MRIEIFTLPGCERCESVVARLRAADHDVRIADLGTVWRGEHKDVEVLTQINVQDGYAPVIRVAATDHDAPRFIDPDDLDAWLKGREAAGISASSAQKGTT